MRTPIFMLVAFLISLPWPDARAAAFYNAGFRTLGEWTEEPPIRIDVGIWYPTMRQPKDLNYPPWTISAAPNGRPAEGRFPLLLLSHASSSDRLSYHTLAAELAKAGYVVAAPGHSQDNIDNMDDLFTFSQLERRCQELVHTLKLVLAHKEIAGMVDKSRIGFIGFGSGATAGLLLGGALPTCDGWPKYCETAGSRDVYCSPWAMDRMKTLCEKLPLASSLANPAIRAIAAISPGYGMLFDQASLKYFYPPLLLVCAGRDQFNACRLHCEPLARLLGKRARFLEFPDADAGALTAPCPPALAAELPELCQSVTSKRRAAITAELTEALLAFFGHYFLAPDNLPTIPRPPDLKPRPAEIAAPQAVPDGKKSGQAQRRGASAKAPNTHGPH